MKNLSLILGILFISQINISTPKPTLNSYQIVVLLDSISTTIIPTTQDTIQVSPAKEKKNLPIHVQKFINENLALAKRISDKYGIPIPITLGVAALESGWGRSKAAKERNNHFGLHGGSKVYENKKECYKAFGRLLSKAKRYKPLQGVTNYKEYCRLLHTTGYNPYSFYPDKLIKVIEFANLQNLT